MIVEQNSIKDSLSFVHSGATWLCGGWEPEKRGYYDGVKDAQLWVLTRPLPSGLLI